MRARRSPLHPSLPLARRTPTPLRATVAAKRSLHAGGESITPTWREARRVPVDAWPHGVAYADAFLFIAPVAASPPPPTAPSPPPQPPPRAWDLANNDEVWIRLLESLVREGNVFAAYRVGVALDKTFEMLEVSLHPTADGAESEEPTSVKVTLDSQKIFTVYECYQSQPSAPPKKVFSNSSPSEMDMRWAARHLVKKFQQMKLHSLDA